MAVGATTPLARQREMILSAAKGTTRCLVVKAMTPRGGKGNDTWKGDLGNDVLIGNRKRDVLRGGEGDDIPGKKADRLHVADDDYLNGGKDDKLTGGAGADVSASQKAKTPSRISQLPITTSSLPNRS